MFKDNNFVISEAEWEIMRVVWAQREVTSRIIIDSLADKMDWSESTIKTMISRLVDKDILYVKEKRRPFIYSTKINEKDILKKYSVAMLDQICNKQESIIVETMLVESKLTKKDIKKFINILNKRFDDVQEEVACDCMPGQCNCNV